MDKEKLNPMEQLESELDDVYTQCSSGDIDALTTRLRHVIEKAIEENRLHPSDYKVASDYARVNFGCQI